MFFTTIKIKEGLPIALKRHLDKFFWNFKALNQPPPNFDLKALYNFLDDPLYQKGTWRLNISGTSNKKVSFKMTAYQESLSNYSSLKIYSKPFSEPLAQFKKTDFSKRLELLKEAHSLGYEDWIFYDQEQHLLETAIANVFWVEDQTLYVPDASLSYYFGVTLQLVIESSQDLGLKVVFVKENPSCLLQNKQVFICNSMKGIKTVNKIDNQELNVNEELLEALERSYLKLVSQEDALLTKK